MSDMIFEPFGEALPAATPKAADSGRFMASVAGQRIYRIALAAFWVIVAVIVVARVAFYGNIFAFGS